jgi:Ca-activated chloride channel family protein
MFHERLVRRVCACVALVCAASVAQAADRPMFTAGTRIVTLPSTVTDGENRIVLNLTSNDFEVLEDNRQQPVTFFDTTILPIRVVVLLDTSASMAGTVRLLRTAAREFVTRLLPGDACRVGAFNDSVQFGGAFTSDRTKLAQDIDMLEVGDATRLYDALAAGLDTLEGGADRRVILVLTDGADTESRTGLRSVIGRARADGVMVYAIGIERTRFNGTRPVVSVPDRGLKKLTEETGGGYFALKTTTDLGTTFARIADELHSQYVIGFSPERLDGRPHTLAVKVKRPGLTVRGRRSYVAARESISGPD